VSNPTRRPRRQDSLSVKQSPCLTAKILPFRARLAGHGALVCDAVVVRGEPAEYVPLARPDRANRKADALAYGAAGISVFPCRNCPDDPKNHKTPLVGCGFKHGHNDATCDPKRIARAWDKWPDALIGAPTGDKFAVLDLDEKNGHHGLQQIPDWKRRSNVISRTGSGGAHLFFKAGNIRNSTGKIADGVDTRGAGGYVILPPSSGYYWERGNLLRGLGKLKDWPDDLRPTPAPQANGKAKLLKRAVRKEKEPANYNELKAMLDAIPADCDYETWYQIGCALYHELGEKRALSCGMNGQRPHQINTISTVACRVSIANGTSARSAVRTIM
jgi:hypothetical protein